jgi:hypothetical protein
MRRGITWYLFGRRTGEKNLNTPNYEIEVYSVEVV